MLKRILNAGEVARLTGTPRATLYKWAAKLGHPFPKPIKISDGRKGLRWREEDVDRYIQARTAERDQQQTRIRSIFRKTG